MASTRPIIPIVAFCLAFSGCLPSDSRSDALRKHLEPQRKLIPVILDQLQHATDVDLVSLKPVENYSPTTNKSEDDFHSWKILGIVRSIKNDDRDKVISSLKSELAKGGGPAADCFDPRHGLVIHLHDSTEVDLVICFHCKQMWFFDESGSWQKPAIGITRELESVLNDILKRNQVRIHE